jgi:hypothetical protein
MSRVFVPSRGTKDWKRIYNNPGVQWQRGNPGRALAHCWERKDGFPNEVLSLFSGSGIPSFRRLEPLLAFLDYKVPMPSGDSRHDLFALARDRTGQLVSIAVLGKVLAPFGPTIGEWLKQKYNGSAPAASKKEQLQFICDQLELTEPPSKTLTLALLHHAALAVTSAQRFAAPTAALIVHAFGQKSGWVEEYTDFLQLFNARRTTSGLHLLKHTQGVALYCGWVSGHKKFLRK